MKKRYNLFFAFWLLISMTACNKELDSTSHDVMYTMLVNKNWYLDYSITGNGTQAFVGQSTYFITYLKDGTTKDSDGLTGTFSIQKVNNNYEIQVTAKTVNGNSVNYTHSIETIGEGTMIQSYTASGQTTKTKLYFTSK